MANDTYKKFTFKAEDLEYPSTKEIKYANEKCPKFSNFNFEYKDGLVQLFNGIPIKDASTQENLYWWDIILLNRFGSLRGAYFDALTHYNRGFAEDHLRCTDDEKVNRLLFDNSAEVFYYFFFVARDVIAQIIRIYYDLNIGETQLYFNDNFIQLTTDPEVKEVLKEFLKITRKASTYRHGFTHRFPLNYPDYRSTVGVKNGRKTFSAGSGKFTPPSKILENIEDSLDSLSDLMKGLKHIIILK